MARLIMSGGEIRDHLATNAGSPDGWTGGAGTCTTELTNYRSGSAAIACSGTSVNDCYRIFGFTAPASGATLFGRAFLRFSALPSATKKIVSFLTVADAVLVSVRLTSAGKFQLWNDVAGTQIGSDSTLTAAVDTYYRVQLRLKIAAGATDEAEMRVYEDLSSTAEEAVSGTSLTVSDTHASRFRCGWVEAPGVTSTMLLDDIGVNDSTGTMEKSWCGPGRVVLSLPVRTSWTAATATDCSGTAPDATGANMANAINNTPPLGVADHTTAGHASSPDQVRLTSTSSIKFWCQSHAMLGAVGDVLMNFGLGAGDTRLGYSGGYGTGEGSRIAQAFFVNGTIESITPRVTRFGSGALPGTIDFDLVEDVGLTPTGALIQSWSLTSATPTTPFSRSNPTEIGAGIPTLSLTNPIPGGRVLWMIARYPTTSTTDYFIWKRQAAEFLIPEWPAASDADVGTWTTTYAQLMQFTVQTTQGVRTAKVSTAWMCHGEAIATGTKTYSGFGLAMIETFPVNTTGNIGNDVGAAGTYPTNWTWTAAPSVYRPPARTASSDTYCAPRVAATVTSATRFSLVCFLGVYMEYDEEFSSVWRRYQKTSDSSFWWGKQVLADTTIEAGTDGQTIVTASSGNMIMYPDPQVVEGGNFPTTTTSITWEALQSGYTEA